MDTDHTPKKGIWKKILVLQECTAQLGDVVQAVPECQFGFQGREGDNCHSCFQKASCQSHTQFQACGTYLKDNLTNSSIQAHMSCILYIDNLICLEDSKRYQASALPERTAGQHNTHHMNRFQHARANGVKSSNIILNNGVPQGCVLSPTRFFTLKQNYL